MQAEARLSPALFPNAGSNAWRDNFPVEKREKRQLVGKTLTPLLHLR